MPESSPAQLPAWLDEFHLFSWVHGAIVALCAALIVLSCIWGRRHQGTLREDRARRVAGGLFVLVYLVYSVFWFMPDRFEIGTSLPCHVCDIAGVLSCVSLLAPSRLRWPTTIVYFWGITLCTQGFITPTLFSGPAHVRFWLFFFLHGLIVGTAAYSVAARAYEPTWRDYRLAVLAGIAYVLFATLLNFATGGNYGYVSPRPTPVPTIVDLLGPWPWRVILMALIAIAGMACTMLPWVVRDALRRPAARTLHS